MLRLLWWSNGLDHASSAGDTGWIPCWGTKVLHAMGVAKKKKKKKTTHTPCVKYCFKYEES